MQETSDAEWVSLQGLAWLMESSLQAAELLRDRLWELFSFRSHKSKLTGHSLQFMSFVAMLTLLS